MAEGAPSTIFSSSGSGARSNGSMSSCGNIARWDNSAPDWPSFLNITTASGGIPRLKISRLRRYMNDDQENGKERDQTGNRASFSFSKFIVKKPPFVVLQMGSASLT